MPESVPLTGEVVLLLELLDHTPIKSRHIQERTKRDPVLSKVHQVSLNGWPHHCQDVQLHSYLSRKAALTIESGCVLWENRVMVPPQGRAQVIAELHDTHPGISRMNARAHGVVAKHGSWVRRCSYKVSVMPTAPKGPSISTTPPMGVARSTLVKGAHWLCRAI